MNQDAFPDVARGRITTELDDRLSERRAGGLHRAIRAGANILGFTFQPANGNHSAVI